MKITVEIPDELIAMLVPEGKDPARQVLEDAAVEAYREHRLTEHELARLLGMGRYDLDGFLKAREVWLEYSVDDFEQDLQHADRLRERREAGITSSTRPK